MQPNDAIRTGTTLLFFIAAAVFSGGPAHAVDLIADGRMVTTFSDSGSTTTVPPVPFEPFFVSRQNSSVGTSVFSGTGNGYGESDFFFFIAESIFDITFEATEPTDIALSGFLTADSGDFGYSNVRVRLFEGAGMTSVIYSDNVDSGFGYVEGPVGYNATLLPGVYRLVLQTDITPGGFDTTGTWDFTADFTPNDTFDSDGDGIPDIGDNCTMLANAGQADSDGDSIGNQCDPDIAEPNDCQVNFDDLQAIKVSFFSTPGDGNWNPAADLSGGSGGEPDAIVNFADLQRMKDYFFGPPGPSASGCN